MASAKNDSPLPFQRVAPKAERERYWKIVQGGERRHAHNPKKAMGRFVGLAVRLGVPPTTALAHAKRSPGVLSDAFRPGATSGKPLFTDRGFLRYYDRTDDRPYQDGWEQTEARTEIAKLRPLAETMPLPFADRLGTARRVLLAHIDTACSYGSRTYPAAVRYIADKAGVSKGSVDRAHRRLREAGLIAVAQPAGNHKESRAATRWQLARTDSTSWGGVRSGTIEPCVAGLAGLVVPPGTPPISDLANHPTFRPGTGLRGDVWAQIAEREGWTCATLAEHRGTPKRSVQKQVQRLVAAGLVERMGDQSLRAVVDVALLNQIAESVVVSNGHSAAARHRRQIAQHEQDREAHKAFVQAELAIKADPPTKLHPVTPDGYVLDRDTGELQLAVGDTTPPKRQVAQQEPSHTVTSIVGEQLALTA